MNEQIDNYIEKLSAHAAKGVKTVAHTQSLSFAPGWSIEVNWQVTKEFDGVSFFAILFIIEVLCVQFFIE